MSLTDDNTGMVMPVGPMYAGGGFGGGMGGFGGDWGWIILLLLVCGNGWGGFGGFGGMGGFAADGAALYPWMNQSQQINDGFRDQMLNNSVTSIQNAVTSGFGDVQMALCNGFAGVEQGANARQMADMQQMFSLQQQLAQCCCDNRLATCQTQNIVQSESAATRFADANNTRDIVESQTRNTQAILDKLCALELDGYKRENDNLRSQLNMATLRESQTAQNAFIAQGFADEVDQLYNRLSNCPVPSTPVYGRTPIFTCNGNNGCGCGNF
jgi:hypothetical protein